MNHTPVNTPPPPRPTALRRLPRWLLWCGTFVALIGIFYGEEDWRGQRDWNQYRKSVEARGDHLEFQAYVPKPVPDEQNFAEAEIVKPWMQTFGSAPFLNDLYSRAENNVWQTNTSKTPGHRHFEDLVAWQMAADALQAGPLDPNQKFATDKTDLPSRAQAAGVILEGMKPDEAGFAAVQPVWEGLAEHRWTESQLPELESCFQRYDFLADLDQSLKAERTFGIRELDYIKKKGIGTLASDSTNYSSIGDFFQTAWPRGFLNIVGRLVPDGWYDLERLNYCALYDAQTQGVMDLDAARIYPARVVFNSAAVSRQLPDDDVPKLLKFILYHKAFAAEGGPQAISGSPKTAAIEQTTANQAALACALERYRLANGKFPDKLEALVPQFISHLPNDVLTGQPYKYRRTDDGQFVLYSVGWNEKDDGGVPGERIFDDKQGDWVWDYPPK